MKYEIIGETMPVVEIELVKGEKVKSQAGAMKWMDDTIQMDTNMEGGIGGFLKRKMMGESSMLNTFESQLNNSKIAFGHTFPGHIIPLNLDNESIICQRRSFLCADENIELEISFQKKLGSGFFSGEGFVLQELKGTGNAFVEIDGEVVKRELKSGESLKVETGAVAMFTPSVDMNIERIKGFSNMLFGGEGLFLTTLTGPGEVWLQTMPIQSMAGELNPYITTEE